MDTKFKLTEQNYHYLFDSASDAIWVHNMKGDILVANKACEKLTGYSREELLGMNITRFLADEFLNKAREVRRKLLGGEPFEQPYEQRITRKDGTTGIMKMSTSLVIIDGKIKGFQHIARDVTEEKQMQENMRFYVQQITRVQEDERKRIARELHDDMATPLLLLIQRLDSITRSRPKLNLLLKEDLENVRSQAVVALEYLRRCAQALRPRILDDLGLVAALEWMIEDLEKNYGISAQVEVVGTVQNLPLEVQLLLFRIAQEALSNIRRHAGVCQARVKLEPGDKIRMTISDNGKGFELPSDTQSLAGSGKLGIIGMYERARLLGGSLTVRSEPGKGTQVITEVPLPK